MRGERARRARVIGPSGRGGAGPCVLAGPRARNGWADRGAGRDGERAAGRERKEEKGWAA